MLGIILGVIVGVSNVNQVEEVPKACEVKLSEEEKAGLESFWEKISSKIEFSHFMK